MARASGLPIAATATRRRSAVGPDVRRMATTEARQSLPQLVGTMRSKTEPSEDLFEDAVEIGPHRKGGALLVPEIDVRAHAEREAELSERVHALEDLLDDVLLAEELDRRYGGQKDSERKPLEQVERELYATGLLDDAR